jgi:hypothetical protein
VYLIRPAVTEANARQSPSKKSCNVLPEALTVEIQSCYNRAIPLLADRHMTSRPPTLTSARVHFGNVAAPTALLRPFAVPKAVPRFSSECRGFDVSLAMPPLRRPSPFLVWLHAGRTTSFI